MKKRNLAFIILIVFLLSACMSKEQKTYEELMEQSEEKITAGDFEAAHGLLVEAVEVDYEENEEAKKLLGQLTNYQQLENLLQEGKFEELKQTIATIVEVEDGSSVIIAKANEVKEIAKQETARYEELAEQIEAALHLAEAEKYEEANEKLHAIDIDSYTKSYYIPLREKRAAALAKNEERLVEIEAEKQRVEEEARKKAAAEKKAQEEAAKQNNKLTWSDAKIEQYIANYLNRKREHLLIDISDRSNTGYNIEVRQDNYAMGVGDPSIAPAVGFFEVRSDGKLYQMDIGLGEYELVE